MGRWRIGAIALEVVLGSLAVGAVTAAADGLPVPGITIKPGGTAAPGSKIHFVSRTRAGRTTVDRVDWRSGKTVGELRLNGLFTVPAVALDGSPGGISADGRTLTLIRPRVSFPQAHTHLAILNTRPLGLRDRVSLPGDFSFDAISPDGARIYLIQYLSRTDPTKYAVRAYDVADGRLLAKPIVDPTEPDEQMRGYPRTRVASPDGRWAYTLYDGNGKTPFVHALDTARGTARCIDLPSSMAKGVYDDDLRVSPSGGLLTISARKGPVATIDTGTFKVTPVLAPTRPNPETGGADGLPWVLLVAGGALALVTGAGAAMAMRRRRRELAAS